MLPASQGMPHHHHANLCLALPLLASAAASAVPDKQMTSMARVTTNRTAIPLHSVISAHENRPPLLPLSLWLAMPLGHTHTQCLTPSKTSQHPRCQAPPKGTQLLQPSHDAPYESVGKRPRTAATALLSVQAREP